MEEDSPKGQEQEHEHKYDEKEKKVITEKSNFNEDQVMEELQELQSRS